MLCTRCRLEETARTREHHVQLLYRFEIELEGGPGGDERADDDSEEIEEPAEVAK